MKIKIVPPNAEIGLKSERDIHKIRLINQNFSLQKENCFAKLGVKFVA